VEKAQKATEEKKIFNQIFAKTPSRIYQQIGPWIRQHNINSRIRARERAFLCFMSEDMRAEVGSRGVPVWPLVRSRVYALSGYGRMRDVRG